MTKAQCDKCRARIEGHVHSEEQMAGYCKECKYLKRLESPGMIVVPVYDMAVIAKAASSDSPILTRHGMTVLGV